jgi:hypothetical protein
VRARRGCLVPRVLCKQALFKVALFSSKELGALTLCYSGNGRFILSVRDLMCMPLSLRLRRSGLLAHPSWSSLIRKHGASSKFGQAYALPACGIFAEILSSLGEELCTRHPLCSVLFREGSTHLVSHSMPVAQLCKTTSLMSPRRQRSMGLMTSMIMTQLYLSLWPVSDFGRRPAFTDTSILCKQTLAGWSEEVRALIPPAMLKEHFGLYYLDSRVELPGALQASLGVPTFGPNVSLI